MIVTSIKVQKKNKERVSVFLDEEFWAGMSLSALQQLDLRRGQELTEKEKKVAEETVIADNAFQVSLNYLSSRPRSEKQIRDKLTEKEFPPKTIDEAISKCKELLFIDDRRFAVNLSESKKRQKYGKKRAEMYLNKVGIEKEVIKEVLDEVYQKEDEEADALLALEKKYKDSILDTKESQKALAYLVRRGFSFESASSAISQRKMPLEEEKALKTLEAAQAALQKRYRGLKEDQRNKAIAYLQRQGFNFQIAQEAFEKSKEIEE